MDPNIGTVHGDRRGFTLVEIVVAVVILALSVLGTASLTAMLMRANGGSTDRTRAVEALRLKVEDMQSTAYGSIDSGSDTWTVGALTVSRTWTVTADSPAPGLKTVDLTASWDDRRGHHTIRTQTIRGKY